MSIHDDQDNKDVSLLAIDQYLRWVSGIPAMSLEEEQRLLAGRRVPRLPSRASVRLLVSPGAPTVARRPRRQGRDTRPRACRPESGSGTWAGGAPGVRFDHDTGIRRP